MFQFMKFTNYVLGVLLVSNNYFIYSISVPVTLLGCIKGCYVSQHKQSVDGDTVVVW